jgi:hypothetical protein
MQTLDISDQCLVFGAPGFNRGFERADTTKNAATEVHSRLYLTTILVSRLSYIENSQRLGYGQPHRRAGEISTGTNAPSMSEDMLCWIRLWIRAKEA